MASIFSKRGELWLGWFELNSTGEQIHPQINLHLKDTKLNRKIADKIKGQKELELKNTPITFQEKILTNEAIKRFINSKKYKSKNTIQNYSSALLRLKAIPKRYVKELNKDDMTLLIDKMKAEHKSEETIKSYLRNLKIFFEFCIKQNFISNNPVPNYKTKRNSVVKIISDEALSSIFQHFRKRNKKHYYFLKILNITGLRISELVQLKWEDINRKEKTIVIKNTKGGRIEEIPMLDEAEKIFNEIEYEGYRVFNYKSRHSANCIKRELNKFGATFHDFRRSFGTRWSKELKPFELKTIMRHKDLRTTDKYYVHNDIKEIRNKMSGCGLVAELNEKSQELYKINTK